MTPAATNTDTRRHVASEDVDTHDTCGLPL
jgi:hypothetical protein